MVDRFRPDKELKRNADKSGRAQRRRDGRSAGAGRTQEISRGISRTHEQLVEAATNMNNILHQAKEQTDQPRLTLSYLAFHAEPYAQKYLLAGRRIHEQYLKVKDSGRFNEESVEADIQNLDIYGRSFHGTSLVDIEGMEPDHKTGYLPPEDMRKINRMFRDKGNLTALSRFKYFKQPEGDSAILESVLVFTAQGWARPEALDSTPQLRKLHRNLSAYFDYYVDVMMDPAYNPDDEANLLMALSFVGPEFVAGFGAYLPARLGITPSSTTKAYIQKDFGIGWQKLRNKYLDTPTNDAHLVGILPDDLAQYQHYDSEMDRKAAQILREHYAIALNADEDQLKAHETATQARDGLIDSYPSIMRRIVKSQDKKIDIALERTAAQNITITTANRRTLMFVLHMQGGTHLTLELNKTGRIFGIPPELQKKHPNIQDMILSDILPPLLSKFETRKPEVKTAGTLYRYQTQPSPDAHSDAHDEEVRETRVKKRAGRFLGGRSHGAEPELPTPTQSPEKVRFVAHSEDQIKTLLGGSKATDKDVRVAMDQIRLFEYGAHGEKNLGHALKGYVSLRVFGRRLILQEVEINGTTSYILHSVQDREELDTAGRGYKPLIRKGSKN